MDVLLVRVGEITLKSEPVRRRLERKLIYNALEALGDLAISYEREPGRLYFYAKEPVEAAERLARVFGIVGVALAKEYELDSASPSALRRLAEAIAGDVEIRGSFAVRVRRVGEHGFTSPEAARIIGEAIGKRGHPVDLENPDTVVRVEIRGRRVFAYTREIPGPGGLPLGTEGNAIALISGGIDSPVAARYAMRRGVVTHFLHGRPVDDEEYLENVRGVVRILRGRAIGENPRFFVADMREFVKAASRYGRVITVLLKRRLMRIANELSESLKAEAVILGDSIGQVASQTLRNMRLIDEPSELVVLRPLAGLDKREIVEMARRIGTLAVSERQTERAARYARRAYARAPREIVEKAEEELESIETPVREEG